MSRYILKRLSNKSILSSKKVFNRLTVDANYVFLFSQEDGLNPHVYKKVNLKPIDAKKLLETVTDEPNYDWITPHIYLYGGINLMSTPASGKLFTD